MYLDPDVEEDLPREQEGSQIPDTVISGLFENLPVEVPVVLSFWARPLLKHHNLFPQNS